MPFLIPRHPGFDTDANNTLRLWSAQASSEINLGKFNQGGYFAAVEDKNHSENESRVLYPDDSTYSGRELRLRQEYFLVSATVQDILTRHYQLYQTYVSKRTVQYFNGEILSKLNATNISGIFRNKILIIDNMVKNNLSR